MAGAGTGSCVRAGAVGAGGGTGAGVLACRRRSLDFGFAIRRVSRGCWLSKSKLMLSFSVAGAVERVGTGAVRLGLIGIWRVAATTGEIGKAGLAREWTGTGDGDR